MRLKFCTAFSLSSKLTTNYILIEILNKLKIQINTQVI